MMKSDVIEELCGLARKVGEEKFKSVEPYDCICQGAPHNPYYQFSHKVLEFIKNAVAEKLAKEA